jgi:plastocyanin
MIVNHLSLFPIVSVIILAASVASSAGEKDGDKKPEANSITVEMKSLSYSPKIVDVPVGDTVVWTNKAFATHTATSDDGKAFDTGEIKPDETSSPVKFNKGGEFKYHCKIHGTTMSGVVIVKPAGAN